MIVNSVIGRDAPQLIELLVSENPEIRSIKLFRPKFLPPAQDVPTLLELERRTIEEGLKLRDQLGLSFWDATLLSISTHPVEANNLLKIATRHNPQDDDHTIVQRVDCNESNLRRAISQLTPGQILAVSSATMTTGELVRHIPMLDFHCRDSSTNLETIKTILRELNLSGYIAMSGGSYHFYGRELVNEHSLVSLLARALLFSPIVDHRWVAHQLMERACGLRISPGKIYRTSPQVIAEV